MALRGQIADNANDEAAFWESADKSGDCWVWTLALVHDGYGSANWRGGKKRAHRLAYELTYGPIEEGMTLDHLCQNKACIRPDHLEPVTSEENIRRAAERRAGQRLTRNAKRPGRTQDRCGVGHALTDENLYVAPSGSSYCRTCRNDRRRARYAADKNRNPR
jgi:hypothetical protein